MAKLRTCMLCGTQKEYCPTCPGFNSDETWRILFHDENCLAISKVWYAYRGGEITKDEAKEQMNKYPESLEKIFKYTSLAAKEIRAIFDIPEEEPEKEEVPVEEKQEAKTEEKVSTAAKQSFKNNNYKNYKK